MSLHWGKWLVGIQNWHRQELLAPKALAGLVVISFTPHPSFPHLQPFFLSPKDTTLTHRICQLFSMAIGLLLQAMAAKRLQKENKFWGGSKIDRSYPKISCLKDPGWGSQFCPPKTDSPQIINELQLKAFIHQLLSTTNCLPLKKSSSRNKCCREKTKLMRSITVAPTLDSLAAKDLHWGGQFCHPHCSFTLHKHNRLDFLIDLNLNVNKYKGKNWQLQAVQ